MNSNKLFYVNGDFNLNAFDYIKNEKVSKFLNLTFEYSLVPVINKPTCITKTTADAIDHIITTSVLHRTIDVGVIKLDILNHFPIYLVAGTGKRMTLGEKVQITKLLIDNESKEKFENTLQKMT